MITIKNKLIPFGNFKAINLFGVVFYKGSSPSKRTLNHEAIHTEQIKDLLYVFYYPVYIITWLLAGLKYRENCFEKEAFDNDTNKNYITTRKRFAWLKYFRYKL